MLLTRLVYVSSAMIVASIVAKPALAANQDNASSSANTSNLSEGLAEIVVTAERRSERLQDVPIAVTAVTSDTLTRLGATGLSNLPALVPSLSVQRRGNNAQTLLRGLGSSIGDLNAESSVAIYIDGVYQPTGNARWADFNNIERVEVLKGPQGTLFGRNATGGVIQIITRNPSQSPDLDFSVDYASYDKVTAAAYGSVPLGSNAAVNLSARYSDQEGGWGRNLTTGAKTGLSRDYGFRGKFLFTPTSVTKIVLSADYTNSSNDGINGQPVPGGRNAAGQGFPGRYNSLSNFTNKSHTEAWGVSARLDHDFGPVQLASISAYQKYKGLWQFDPDLSPLNLANIKLTQRAETITQEIHLLSPADSKFQWLVGGYYFHYKPGQVPLEVTGSVFGPVLGTRLFASTTAESESVFAQGTYPIATRTKLTLGIRYTWDRVDYAGYSTTVAAPTVIINPSTGVPRQLNLSYQKPTWRFALNHDFVPDVMGYVSYNRGVKAGNIGISTPATATLPYNPERIDAYEIGIKSELFDRRLRLNTAFFYYDAKDLQFSRVIGGTSVVVSGPSATLYGGEVEVDVRATRDLTLNASLGLVHARFGDFPNAPSTVRLANGLTGRGPDNFDATNNRLPFAASLTGNVGFTYVVPTTKLGRLSLTANAAYNSGYRTEIDNRLRVGSYTLVNSSIEWRFPDDSAYIRIWGKNLANAYYYAQLQGQAGNTDLGTAAEPRTFGITIGYKYR